MAADLSQSGSGQPISAINVTPFVDVMLVLLVIFMVTAPAMMKDIIGIKLPKATEKDAVVSQTVGVAVNRAGQILFNGELLDENVIEEELQKALIDSPDLQAIIAADEEAKHGDVVRAINLVKRAGVEKFAIQIRRPST